MALEFHDNVHELWSGSGTGTMALGGAVTGKFAFDDVFTDGATVKYRIDDGAGSVEIGEGTFTSSGTTLSRDRVIASTAGGSKVVFGSGDKDVRAVATAEEVQAQIETIDADSLPSANNLDITDIRDVYRSLLLRLTGLSMDTASRAIYVRVSIDNGSSFDAANNAGAVLVGGSSTAAFTTYLAQSGTAQGAGATLEAQFEIAGYQAGPYALLRGAGKASDGSAWLVQGAYVGTGAIDALRVIMNDTGNFDAGTYALYGIR